MKKTCKFLLVLTLIMIFSTMLVACQDKDADGLIKLDAPVISVDKDAISWDAVEHAEKYLIKVEGIENEIETTKTTYTLSLTQVGSYKVQVRAVGDGKKYGTSDYSNEETCIKGQTLKQPEVAVDKNGLVTWKAVENAANYSVIIKNRAKELVYQFNTTELSYNLFNDADKEKFANPNAYSITVQALPTPDDILHVQSFESPAVKYIKRGQLNVPKFSDITTTTMWWDKVDADILKYDRTTIVKYEIKLEYEENGEKKEDTYLTTDNNIGIANFKLPVSGEYKTSIRAVGDEVYESSAYSEVRPEFNLIKLNAVDKNAITFTQDDKSLDGVLNWHVASVENIDRFNIILETYKADGTKALTASDYKSIDVNKDETTGEETPVLDYTFNVKKLFFDEIIEEGKQKDVANKTIDEYYGRVYKVSIIAEGSNAGTTEANRIIDSEKITLDQTYENYIKPIKSGDYYLIDRMSSFSYIKYEPDANYSLKADIDFRGYAYEPIPNFTGILEGNDYTLKNYVVTAKEGTDNVGIFGKVTGSINRLFFNNVNLNYEYAAKNIGLVAGINEGSIDEIYVTGDTAAHKYNKEIKEEDRIVAENVGGIFAVNKGSISNSVADVSVYGSIVGGLVAINNGNITYSYAIGKVNGSSNQKLGDDQLIVAGGLVGINEKGTDPATIFASFADNKVKGDSNKLNAVVKVGGLVGVNGAECKISTSYAGGMYSRNATSIVEIVATGSNAITGGLVAENRGAIDSTYSTLKAIATSKAAGLVAVNYGTIANSYSVGGVGNNGTIGGLVATNEEGATVTNCYFKKPNNDYYPGGDTVGTLVEDKDLSTLHEKLGDSFGKFSDRQAPVLRGVIYLPEYKMEIKQAATGTHTARIIDITDGKTQELISSGETFKYILGKVYDDDGKETEAIPTRGDNVRAKFMYKGVSIQVLVTIK